MQQIVNFIIRYKNFLLYIFLLTISLGLTIQSHSYHQSRFFNSSNWISGTVYDASQGVSSYFELQKENKALVEDNIRLRRLLFNILQNDSIKLDSAQKTYTVTAAKIIKNSYTNQRNYITIDKGEKDSVKIDMGVITDNGIIGIIENNSNKFATVQSILNEKSNINAKIKNTNHFGSLVWNTKNYTDVQLIDIPRLVPLLVGDTIVTGAMSSIFPENIPIGTINKFDLDESENFYTIDVALFNDMTNIKDVYVVSNANKKEIEKLQLETSSDD